MDNIHWLKYQPYGTEFVSYNVQAGAGTRAFYMASQSNYIFHSIHVALAFKCTLVIFWWHKPIYIYNTESTCPRVALEGILGRDTYAFICAQLPVVRLTNQVLPCLPSSGVLPVLGSRPRWREHHRQQLRNCDVIALWPGLPVQRNQWRSPQVWLERRVGAAAGRMLS